MGDHAAPELEGGISRIVRGRLIFPALFVVPLRNVCATEASHAFDLAEEVVEHVAPVADHIEDDSAAILFPVVPRRPLRLLPAAFENPIAELSAHREQAAEETGI